MAQPFTGKPQSFENVAALKSEILRLKERIVELEQQISDIQQKCRHVFFETPVMRKCIKCHYAESLYY
ncbi:hypothetical protein B0I26_107135 [Anoxybacillus vitaminiphilus]|jgi:uncharacterized protein (UPF0335 family)|uniref:Uncharacterized protein n=1 Tax=Paranoxybacillus vitaminiphilus TaxID=581036 RepID=A0A327YHD4_9BACL|nr:MULTISPECIES: hypothetical protein [Anoxybacillus]MCQ5365004.1 hypothetical protein [Anoxybacillus gonensis]RAK19215.1 hypothetical protein B0I26_107135 [Anoxybacillus vitaminiphilus]